MKSLILFFLAGIVFTSCNNQGTASKDTEKDSMKTTSSTVPNYSYTIDHPDYWEMGNTANTEVALKAVKAFEVGNIEECIKYFGDSVKLQFDGLDKKVSKDSAKAMFANWRSNYKSMDVKMKDWESVVSKDKKEEWVTIWYRQSWEDMKGEKDSSDFIDDLQLKDGKIVRLDEYTRKLH